MVETVSGGVPKGKKLYDYLVLFPFWRKTFRSIYRTDLVRIVFFWEISTKLKNRVWCRLKKCGRANKREPNMVYSYQQKTRKLNQRNILDRWRTKLEISLSASTSENMTKCSLIFVHLFFVVRCSRVFNSQPKEVLISNRIVRYVSLPSLKPRWSRINILSNERWKGIPGLTEFIASFNHSITA